MDVSKVDNFINAIKTLKQCSVHAEAYSCLENADTGGVERAREIWEEYHKQHPDDYVSAHHLAIVYHSKAWDLEHAGECARALDHWKKALTYWACFLKAATFWNEHIEKMIDFATEGQGLDHDELWSKYVTQKHNLPEEFRDENVARARWHEGLDHWFRKREIPSWWGPLSRIGIPLGGVDLQKFDGARTGLAKALLAIHYSLVWHYICARETGRARSHMDILLKSDFPEDVKPDEIRTEMRRALADKVVLD